MEQTLVVRYIFMIRFRDFSQDCIGFTKKLVLLIIKLSNRQVTSHFL